MRAAKTLSALCLFAIAQCGDRGDDDTATDPPVCSKEACQALCSEGEQPAPWQRVTGRCTADGDCLCQTSGCEPDLCSKWCAVDGQGDVGTCNLFNCECSGDASVP